MKTNIDNKPRVSGKYIDLETRLEQGRQLQSKAIFEFCANMFFPKNISPAKFKAEEQDPRLVESH